MKMIGKVLLQLTFIITILSLVVSGITYASIPKDNKAIILVTIDSTAYYKSACNMLSDSIVKLRQRPVMSINQFVNLYKYDRLLKYYKICKNKQTQWKYYKGWSIRVFEE